MSQQTRRKMAFIYWIAVGIIFLVGFIYWFVAWRNIAYTNDAYVGGNQIYITPLHDGFVTSIHTDDTYLVKQGELLVQLDTTDSLIIFDHAQAHLAETVREVCQMFHQVFIYHSKTEASKAKFVEAAQDFQHRWSVLPENGVSLEEYEHAVAALRTTFFRLQTNETHYNKALSIVQGTTIEEHPLIRAAIDKMRDAWIQLYRCNIYAPVDGLAAQRSIQVGMWTPAGTPLMSLIPLDQIWVNANFKETQLRYMKIGQRVRITSDLYGRDVVYNGKIVGLPGVAGNATSLLPPQNLSGNWIKIVQRLPVRVELDAEELSIHPLRIGLSLEATVDLEDPGILVPAKTVSSPLYKTTIFEKEESGDQDFIRSIISLNLDPTLIDYKNQPLTLMQAPLNLPLIVQDAIFTNPDFPLQPPLPIQMMTQSPPTPKDEAPPILVFTAESISLKPEILTIATDITTIPTHQELEDALAEFPIDSLLNEAMLLEESSESTMDKGNSNTLYSGDF